MRDWRKAFIVLLAFLVWWGASEVQAGSGRSEPRFGKGDVVIDVIERRQGVVLRRHWNVFRKEWMYQLRVNAPATRSCGSRCNYGPYCDFRRDRGTAWLGEVELRILGRYPFRDDRE